MDRHADSGLDSRTAMRLLHLGDAAGLKALIAARPDRWEAVCAALFVSDIPTLFHSMLLRAGLEGELPGEWRGRYAARRNETLAAAIIIQEEFLRVEEMMRVEGVRVSPLKGVSLIEGVYDDIAARTFADIDVFIPGGDGAAAMQILRDNGYGCLWDVAGRRRDDYGSGAQFRRPGPAAPMVELHWNVLEPVGIRKGMLTPGESRELGRLFAERRVEGVYRGRRMPLLRSEDMLLYMLLHIFNHNFRGRKWLWDIALFLERAPAPDWAALFDTVERLRLEKIVHSAFLCAERGAGPTPAPEAVKRHFESMPAAARRVCRIIADTDRENVRWLMQAFLYGSAGRFISVALRNPAPSRRRLEKFERGRVSPGRYLMSVFRERALRLLRP